MQMWTLLNQSAFVAAVGIFPTRADAEMWAEKYLPELELTPIELMLQDSHKEMISEAELFTQDNAPELTVN